MKPEEAVKAFEKAVGFEPKHNRALYELGIVLEKGGNFDKAIEYFQKVILGSN